VLEIKRTGRHDLPFVGSFYEFRTNNAQNTREFLSHGGTQLVSQCLN